MVFAMRTWSFNTDSDTESRGKIMRELHRNMPFRQMQKQECIFALNSHQLGRKTRLEALKILAAYPGVECIGLDRKSGRCSLVGVGINVVDVASILRKKNCFAEILSVNFATEPNYTFPTTVRITELQPDEDTDLERKRSLGMSISEEQQEQSEQQQEDQPPPGQADCYISQVKASLLSRPLPSMSLPLASEARPSPSPVSPPSRGTSDQMQTTSDHVSELSFPFAPSSSRLFWTDSLSDMPARSCISGEACLPKDMELMEEGLGGHDQLSDSAVHQLLSEINGIGERKRHKDLHAGEQASRLKEADDTVIMLRKQVEELEAKLSMANTLERCLRDMVRISEARHAGTERELAFMREEMHKANRRIEYLENEKTEAGASRASIEGETMSTPGPSPPAPRTTPSYVPLLLPVLVSQTWKCARKALFFLNVNSYFGYP